jgi:hypothetical protein
MSDEHHFLEGTPAPWFIPHDHVGLRSLLVRSASYGCCVDLPYVLAVMQADMAELGHLPAHKVWARPGEAPPAGWSIYAAVLHWCHRSQDGQMPLSDQQKPGHTNPDQ